MSLKNIVFVFLPLFVLGVFATIQDPDLLLIEGDTVYLKSFPLEDLELQCRPFGLTLLTAPNSGCWRAYQAIWRLENDSLFLEKIFTCPVFQRLQNDSLSSGEILGYSSILEPSREENILELFHENDLEATVVRGRIFADWYHKELTGIQKGFDSGLSLFEARLFQSRRKRKGKRRLRKEKEKITLSFKKGMVVTNKLEE
ncbi:MAG: hypothetical protein AB8B69_22090 [Chitinophagales bacterium]